MIKFDKEAALKVAKKSDFDTGSTEVQIVSLTKRIQELAEHIKSHLFDNSAKRGLLILVGKRKRLLAYLKRTSLEEFTKISKLIARD